MALVTAAIHAFLYFVIYLKAAPVAGGLMFVILGIPIVGTHVFVWAVTRVAGGGWGFLAALVTNGLCVLVALLWPIPAPGAGASAAWAMNAVAFLAIGMTTQAVLIGYMQFVRRRLR